jgi:hypothetical protein
MEYIIEDDDSWKVVKRFKVNESGDILQVDIETGETLQ